MNQLSPNIYDLLEHVKIETRRMLYMGVTVLEHTLVSTTKTWASQ